MKTAMTINTAPASKRRRTADGAEVPTGPGEFIGRFAFCHPRAELIEQNRFILVKGDRQFILLYSYFSIFWVDALTCFPME